MTTKQEEAIDGMRRGLTQARVYREAVYAALPEEFVLRGGIRLRKKPLDYELGGEAFICEYDAEDDNRISRIYVDAQLHPDALTVEYLVGYVGDADDELATNECSGSTPHEALSRLRLRVDPDLLRDEIARTEHKVESLGQKLASLRWLASVE